MNNYIYNSPFLCDRFDFIYILLRFKIRET